MNIYKFKRTNEQTKQKYQNPKKMIYEIYFKCMFIKKKIK